MAQGHKCETINATGCRFDPRGNAVFYKYQCLLNSAESGVWSILAQGFPLPTLLCVGYYYKLIYLFFSNNMFFF